MERSLRNGAKKSRCAHGMGGESRMGGRTSGGVCALTKSSVIFIACGVLQQYHATEEKIWEVSGCHVVSAGSVGSLSLAERGDNSPVQTASFRKFSVLFRRTCGPP